MNRGLRSFCITLGIAILLFTGGYFFTRPTRRLANAAEIRTQIHPDLLTVPEEQPEARARYDRLMDVVERIPLGNPAEPPAAKARNGIPATRTLQLDALEALLEAMRVSDQSPDR